MENNINIVEAYIKFKGQLVILISGISGTGKKELANHLSRVLKIGYINTLKFYKKDYNTKIKLPSGEEVINWDTDDAVDWKELNKEIDSQKSKGVVVSGEAFQKKNMTVPIDFHLHIKKKKQDIIQLGGYNQNFYPNFDFCYAVLHSKHFNVYKYNQQLFIYRWAENDSRKTSSLEGFVKNDYFLINQILKNNKMPKWMINCYLRYLLKNKLVNMRAIDMQFSLKIEDFGIKELNRFSSFIIKKILNVLRRLIPLLTTTTLNQS